MAGAGGRAAPLAPAAAALSVYLPLPELLGTMLEHYLHAAKTAFGRAAADDEANVRMALLHSISDGLSLQEPPQRGVVYGAGDVASLMLRQADFGTAAAPHIAPAGPLAFKLGQKLTGERAGVDRHRAHCGIVCEISTALRAGSEQVEFPLLARDTKYVFPTARAAAEHMRRAWRYLSENSIPGSLAGAPSCTTSQRYSRLVHPECEEDCPAVGDQCRVFRASLTEQSGLRTAGLPKPADLVIVLMRVRCVVTKLCLASRRAEIPQAQLTDVCTRAADRVRSWCGAVDVPGVLEELPPPLKGHRDEVLRAWRERIEELFRPSGPAERFAAEPCAVCQDTTETVKRCAGCRRRAYCSKECQRKHWQAGHSRECSLEFVTIQWKGGG